MNKSKLLMNVLGVAIIAIMPFLGLMAIYVIPMIVTGLMAVICLMYFIRKPDKCNVKMNLTDVAVLLFVFYGVVRSFFVGGGLQWDFYFKWGALACLYFLFRYFIGKKALCYGLVFGGFIQSVVGLLQISGVMEPSTSLFEITGSFSNPGPYAGFLSVCCICTISFALIKCKEKAAISYVLFGAALFMAVMIILADSRAAVMSVVGAIALLFFYNLKGNIKKWYVISAAAAMVVLVSVLYFYRKDSADGRLLIWRVSADMVSDSPVLGFGPGTFDKTYMTYQMKYFMENPDSDYSAVAGYTKFPYNEFIHVAVECGIVGLVLLLAIFVTVFVGKKTDMLHAPLKCTLLGWCIFACFSYPAEVFILMALLATLLASGGSVEIVHLKGKGVVCLLFAVACGYGVHSFFDYNGKIVELRRVVAMSERRMIEKDSLLRFVESNCSQLQADQHLYDRSVLNLCELGVERDEVEHLIGNVSPSCLNYCTIGRMFVRNCDYDRAEEYFTQAHYMVPTMITPVYEMFRMYVAKGDCPKADVYARKVLEVPIKVENTKTLRAKMDARNFLEYHNHKH